MDFPGANQVHAASYVPIPQGGNDATGVDEKFWKNIKVLKSKSFEKSFEEKKTFLYQVKQQPSAPSAVILRPAKK